MKKIRIGINGMGRIGRTLIRSYLQLPPDSPLSLVAVNNPGNPEEYLHLLKYDSIHGKLKGNLQIGLDSTSFSLNDKPVAFTGFKGPSEIPWSKYEVDIVIDATGKFRDADTLSAHLSGSVKKVILCAPGKKVDATLVMGVNHEKYNPKVHHIISNASCTTNCLAPVALVLDKHFELQSGTMVTIHSYTADQVLQDSAHSDLRRARGAALSMIPTSTGAASALGEVLPQLKGRLDGYAVRVPTPNVSMIDFTFTAKKDFSRDTITQAFKDANNMGSLKPYLGICSEPLVSNDFIGNPYSAIVDLPLTQVIGEGEKKLGKVVAWYDNEFGFSCRVLDLCQWVGSQIP